MIQMINRSDVSHLDPSENSSPFPYSSTDIGNGLLPLPQPDIKSSQNDSQMILCNPLNPIKSHHNYHDRPQNSKDRNNSSNPNLQSSDYRLKSQKSNIQKSNIQSQSDRNRNGEQNMNGATSSQPLRNKWSHQRQNLTMPGNRLENGRQQATLNPNDIAQPNDIWKIRENGNHFPSDSGNGNKYNQRSANGGMKQSNFQGNRLQQARYT